MTRLLVAPLALLALFAGGATALAHANYVKSVPEQDSRLAKPPVEVRVSFSESPEPRLSELRVLDVNGARVDKGDLGKTDDATLRVSLGPIGDGGYTVAWQAVSAVDGHETRGSFAFAVGDAPLPTLPDLPHSPPPSALEILGRVLTYAGTALLIGVPFFALVIATRAEDRRGTRWIARAGGVAVLAGTLPLALSSGGLALVGARLGLLLGARALLAALSLLLPWTRATLVIGALAALTLTLQSHAAAIEDLVGAGLDLAHVLAVCAWVGGLVALALVSLPRRVGAGEPGEVRDLGALVARFSTLGLAAVAVIVATGVLQSLRRLVDVRDLIETPYGLALLAKILLLAFAVALASLNLLRHGPRLRAGGPDATRTRRLLLLGVRGEVIAVALVLVAASILTALAPPNTSTGAAYVSVQHADGLRIELFVQSAIPGRNRWTVRLREGLGAATDVEKVTLRFTMIEHDMGEQELEMRQRAPGEYVADGSPTSMFGTWRTLVIVRRAGREDARALFQYPVSGSGGLVTRVVQAGSLSLIVYTESPLLSAGQPVTLYVVPLDATGNLIADARMRATLEGQTYESAAEPGGRYRFDLPAQTAGNKKLVITVGTAAGDVSGEYDYSVAP